MKKALFALALVAVIATFYVAARERRENRAEQLAAVAAADGAPWVRPHSPSLGAATAKVTIVEFTDPACETCAAFSPILEGILVRYPRQVRLVLRWAPLHAGAEDVVRVLEASRLQGKLWPTLHLLYATQARWTEHHQVRVDLLGPLLAQVPLDVARLQRDMIDSSITATIQQDLADGQALGVDKTPGIFVNGKPLEPFGVEPLLELVDAELAAQYPE